MAAPLSQKIRAFRRICKEWPLDPTKKDRDIAEFIRKKITYAFEKTEIAKVDEVKCYLEYISLERLNESFHLKKMHPRHRTEGTSGYNLETIKKLLSNESFELSHVVEQNVVSRNITLLKSYLFKPKKDVGC
ncbi:Mitochondrial nucleoid factor 1 [Mizuhopecten yessoensis]|uniref:Mitochondrial nucleoid factor 1 n=1 Tax=Mizuhopecten yessoensis TaxID=6573 RepID=A0A210QRF4_MIZYE|nr:Mitochondrial nucleoid factor 1 [Mizuhopecten yessoensis]